MGTGRFFTREDNFKFAQAVEPLQNELAIKYFYSRDGIVPVKNEDQYDIDFLFIDPITGKTVGVEYKTVMPWNWNYKNILVYGSSQNNDNIPNQIFKYMDEGIAHWIYLHPGSNQMFIIFDQNKLRRLYTEFAGKRIPTYSANLEKFDEIINIPEDDPILIKTKNTIKNVVNEIQERRKKK